ncbi:MAG: asparagine synthase (glutamine-hydrolyzing) [Chloroflexi bacterium]|nr:asparagine synthase (glutamine-hydrolyzing) [Chloroflexota bacterium]
MCGICGKIFFNKENRIDESILKKMMDALYHRGPDDEGLYISGYVGLGHRRLSIIDLHTGKQPISNEDKKIWIVFNGEIYNYQELKQDLLQKGHVFETATDTEVIVHSYEEYGEDFISKLRGMFAFAIWDEKERLLLIARDRVGIKPVYYYAGNGFLIFASELKAILQDPSVAINLNYPNIDRFLTYYYTPGAETLIKDIYKLEPGHYIIIKDGNIKITQYWDIQFSCQKKQWKFQETKAQLLELLQESVNLHMISDVPVGLLLSGGVDSTALLNLSMATKTDLSTFTIGFAGEDFADERVYARLAAEKFGTKHYEMTIKAEDFVEFLPKYIWHMEEPVCEPPAIALYYISKLAKEHVKVLISGEGGDEAFAGYQNYRNLIWLEYFKRILGPLNRSIGAVVDVLSDIPLFRRFKKYAPLLSLPMEQYYYSRTSSPFKFFNREFDHLYAPEFKSYMEKNSSIKPTDTCFKNMIWKDNLNKMLYVDTKTWLPDDLLIKADKITMANSIELRVPLLDHKVLEFAASLPSEYKLKGITTKYILKEAFLDRVPPEIIKRKKTGFPVPYQKWFRKELRGYVDGVLLDPKTLNRGYFNKKTIEKTLKNDDSRSFYSKEIFSLLTLELWHRTFFFIF